MKAIFEAIYTKTAGSAMSTAVGGRFYPIQAPISTPMPYIVASIIAETPTYMMTHIFFDVLIEISVFASNATTMHDISELVFALYDRSTLPAIAGYQQVGPMDRDQAQPLIMDDVYRYVIEYRLNLKKL